MAATQSPQSQSAYKASHTLDCSKLQVNSDPDGMAAETQARQDVSAVVQEASIADCSGQRRVGEGVVPDNGSSVGGAVTGAMVVGMLLPGTTSTGVGGGVSATETGTAVVGGLVCGSATSVGGNVVGTGTGSTVVGGLVCGSITGMGEGGKVVGWAVAGGGVGKGDGFGVGAFVKGGTVTGDDEGGDVAGKTTSDGRGVGRDVTGAGVRGLRVGNGVGTATGGPLTHVLVAQHEGGLCERLQICS